LENTRHLFQWFGANVDRKSVTGNKPDSVQAMLAADGELVQRDERWTSVADMTKTHQRQSSSLKTYNTNSTNQLN